MLPKSQRLHCSVDLLGQSKNIDLYRCRNTVQESESMKYACRGVDPVVSFIFALKALNMISIGNLKGSVKTNIEMLFLCNLGFLDLKQIQSVNYTATILQMKIQDPEKKIQFHNCKMNE